MVETALGAAIIPNDPAPFEAFFDPGGKYEFRPFWLPLLDDAELRPVGEARLCVLDDFDGRDTVDWRIRLM